MRSASRQARTDRVPADQRKAKVSIVVGEGEAIGSHKQGETLTMVRHIADFFRRHGIENTDDASVKERLTKAADDQIVSVVEGTDVSDIGKDETENGVRLAAVLEAEFMTRSTEVMDVAQVALVHPDTKLASEFGARVSDAMVADIERGIEGEKDRDAAPIAAGYQLEKDFPADKEAKFWQTVPPIGSQLRGAAKGNKAPFGYRLPDDTNPANKALPIYNGPWHKFRVENSNPPPQYTNGDWVAGFVSSKIAVGLYDRVRQLQALKAGNVREGTPQSMVDQFSDNKDKLNAELNEASQQYNRRVRLTTMAFQFVEKKNALAERTGGRVTIGLVGVLEYNESVEKAARRNKPLCLVTRDESKKGTPGEWSKSPPFAASKLLRMEPKAFPSNVTAATILAPKPKAIAGKATAADKVPSTGLAITNVFQFEDALSAMANYLGDGEKYALVLAQLNDANKGGAIASALCKVSDQLGELEPRARPIGVAYNESVSDALAEEKRAEVQAKEGNGKKKAA